MHIRGLLKAGHTPSLVCAFLYFDTSFMVWVLLGALANSIVPDFGLNEAQRGLMLAVPLLGGSILRLVLGLMTDHMGARRTGIIGLCLTLVPLLIGWLWADNFPAVLLVGLMLGVAGASFAAALPLASRWYPPQYQGMAMGIAGAGNSGTALATLFAPMLARSLGWHAVFGLAMLPILATLVIFVSFAKDSPTHPEPKRLADYAAVFKHADTWWFCMFYSVTFGGFVGLAVFLNSFFYVQYGFGARSSGLFCHVMRHQRFVLAPRRRISGGSLWRDPDADDSVPRRLRDDAGVGDAAGPVSRYELDVPRHGHARHGQRRGVSTGPAAISQGNRRHHRHCRRGRRHWRVFPPQPAGRIATAN
jgi:nitrate/nitrite transporter NarK